MSNSGLLLHTGRQFLIATTGIVSGRSLIESMAGTSATPGSKDAGL
jgi:hypothetical protein